VAFSGGSIGITPSGYPMGDLPICTVTTDESKILALRDDRPDFSNMTAGSGSPLFSDAEAPSGIINGTNVTFTLLNSPTPPASLILMLNGVVQTDGIDYTLLNQDITFANPPISGDTLLAFYRY